MTDETKEKIHDIKEELNESGLPPMHKDSLRSIVNLAASVANGHPDKIQGITDLLLEMVLQDVRKEVRQPGKIAEEVTIQMAGHVKNCPMAGEASAALPRPIAWLYPLRWQVTIIVGILGFAPQAPVVVNAIMKLSGN
jgi:hypothetical protein